jgi:hypothetical protein
MRIFFISYIAHTSSRRQCYTNIKIRKKSWISWEWLLFWFFDYVRTEALIWGNYAICMINDVARWIYIPTTITLPLLWSGILESSRKHPPPPFSKKLRSQFLMIVCLSLIWFSWSWVEWEQKDLAWLSSWDEWVTKTVMSDYDPDCSWIRTEIEAVKRKRIRKYEGRFRVELVLHRLCSCSFFFLCASVCVVASLKTKLILTIDLMIDSKFRKKNHFSRSEITNENE